MATRELIQKLLKYPKDIKITTLNFIDDIPIEFSTITSIQYQKYKCFNEITQEVKI